MKRYLILIVMLVVLTMVGIPCAFAAENQPDIRLFSDAERTQETDTVQIVLGGDRVDTYYTVKGSATPDSTIRATAEDDSVVNVFVLSDRICFVAETGKNSAGVTDVTISADGCASRIIQVRTEYADAASLKLKIDGEKPGYYIEIGTSLELEYGISKKVYADALDVNGSSETLDPELQAVWTFANNNCGASYAEGALSVTGPGTADVTVSLKLGEEELGISKSFQVRAGYQQLASDIDILAEGISITGIRYTAGSDTVSLVYRENGENMSREIALSALRFNYTASNLAYTDPTDCIWSSTDSESVQIADGVLTFGENIIGSKQVTITLTNRDKTVMDSVLIVITGKEPEKSGCGTVGGDAGFGLLGGIALLGTAVVLFRRYRVKSI